MSTITLTCGKCDFELESNVLENMAFSDTLLSLPCSSVLQDKVKKLPHNEPFRVPDVFTPYRILCKQCNHGIGNIAEAQGVEYGQFSCSEVKLKRNGWPIEITQKKWKNAKKLFPEIRIFILPKISSDKKQEILRVLKPKAPKVAKIMLDQAEIPSDLVTLTPRDYQKKIYYDAMSRKEGAVCFLPTGLGKTLIASMVVKRMLQLNPDCLVFFIVDRLPLIFQQSDAITKTTGLEVARMYGEAWTGLTIGVRVVTIMAQVYYNLLSNGSLNLDNVCLLVFDEAHHTTKEHPYNKIMDYVKTANTKHQMVEKTDAPIVKILGLTASPASQKTYEQTLQKLIELEENMGVRMTAPEHTPELERMTVKSAIVAIVVQPTPEEMKFEDMARDAIYTSIKMLRVDATTFHSNPMDANLAKSEIGGYMSFEIKQIAIKNMAGEDASFHNERMKHLTSMKYLVTSIAGVVDFGVEFGIAYLHSKRNFKFPEEILHKLQNIFNEFPLSQAPTTPQNNNGKSSLSPFQKSSKLRALCDWLDKLAEKESIRVLVFVSKRKMAYHLCQAINSDQGLPHIRCDSIVGHGAKKKTSDEDSVPEAGMKARQQLQVSDNFRKNTVNLLVSTSVVEEGYDLPDCDSVIRYDLPSCTTSLVQSKGRARKIQSHMVCLLRKEEKEKLQTLLSTEKIMNDVIKDLTNLRVSGEKNIGMSNEVPFGNPSKVVSGQVLLAHLKTNSASPVPENSRQKLNELAAKTKIVLDKKEFNIGDVHSPFFKCILTFREHTALGEAKTKKDAEEIAADQILQKYYSSVGAK